MANIKQEDVAADSTTTATTPAQKHGVFLDRQDLAIRWNTSISTVKRIEKRKDGIKPIRIGIRTLRYREVDVIAYEEAHHN
ncbi:MAG: hypothetical protein ABIS50_16640 [Luteolibacter sp.]|uniref:helix-turn-helix transcriptional regulator n=1 Tax=Luteolibacter sp. TaxID=1962973 RepID=UPI00326480F5